MSLLESYIGAKVAGGGGSSTLYLHTVTLYFDINGSRTYIDVKIINNSPDKITLSTLYNELQQHKVGAIAGGYYVNGNYYLFCDIIATTDGEDYFYNLSGFEFYTGGVGTFSEYIWSIDTIYDSVSPLS